MRKRALLFTLALGLVFLLSGCKVSGNPLPQGMEEETVLSEGREVVSLLNGEGYQQVYDLLREDAKETSSPEAIQSYMAERLDKAGAYRSEDEAMATGQKIEDTGEEYGTAVFYCKHEKKNVMYRIAYSTEMELMGVQVTVR